MFSYLYLDMSNNKSNGYSSNGPVVVETHHHFLDELYKMMVKDVYDGGKNRDSKVVEFKHPKELEALMDLGLNKETSDDNLLKICQDIIKYSVKTGGFFFFNIWSNYKYHMLGIIQKSFYKLK